MVGADRTTPQSQHHLQKTKRRPYIPLPEALRQNKLQSFPSGLYSVLSATTEKMTNQDFTGEFGLKPPSHVSTGFTEYVDPEDFNSSPIVSPFKSLIKVPPTLNLHGGFAPTSGVKIKREQSQVLAFKIPPAILQTNSPQHNLHRHFHGQKQLYFQ